jgi:hypothetical protein
MSLIKFSIGALSQPAKSNKLIAKGLGSLIPLQLILAYSCLLVLDAKDNGKCLLLSHFWIFCHHLIDLVPAIMDLASVSIKWPLLQR